MKKRIGIIGVIAGISLLVCSSMIFASEGTLKEEAKAYLFENSDQEELMEWDLRLLEPEQLALARNEIYARHGFIFKNKKYQEYFKSKPWYKPVEGVTEAALNAIEKYNIGLIRFYEDYDSYYKDIPLESKAIKKEYIYEPNKKILVDLNGDGIKEKVEYRLENKTTYGEYKKCRLIVNDKILQLEGNLAPKFAIVDIDEKDKYKEILISDFGPSSDNTSKFYFYKNNKLIFMGTTGGIYEEGLDIDGTGTFLASTRGDILQTWWFDKKYQLDRNHKIIPVPTNIYLNYHLVYLKKDLKLFIKNTVKSDTFTVKAGETLIITGNDNKTWCRVKTKEGKEGWFRVTDFTYLPDAREDAPSIFAGLNFAD